MGDKTHGTSPTGVDRPLAVGSAVASIDNNLSGEVKDTVQIQYAIAADRFPWASCSICHLNADGNGARGSSAGGNLAALLGRICAVADLEGGELGNAAVSSRIQAIVDGFGPINFLRMDEQCTGTS